MDLTAEILLDAMHEGAKIKIEFKAESHDEAKEIIAEYAEALGRDWLKIRSVMGDWYTLAEGSPEQEKAYELHVFVWNNEDPFGFEKVGDDE